MTVDKISIVITLVVLSILLMLSPTQAVLDDIKAMPDNAFLLDLCEFNMDIDPEGDEIVNISLNITYLDGYGVEKICSFTPDGKKIKDHPLDEPDECWGIKIDKPNYGYGYELKYMVRVETNKGFFKTHGVGNYSIILTAFSDIDESSSNPATIEILYP